VVLAILLILVCIHFLLLVPVLKEVQWNFVGKNRQNYLLPFLISSLVAIVSNYLMNGHRRLKAGRSRKAASAATMTMALITLALDNILLVLLVRFGNLPYVLAAALAILINFSIRYFIARNWVWKQRPAKTKGV